VTVVQLLLASAAAAGVTAAAVPVIARWAAERRIVAIPNQRSSHARATPVGGGLPIVACVVIGVAIVRNGAGPFGEVWSGYLAAGVFVAAISWWDDMHGTPAGSRLAVQTVAALMVLLPLREVIGPASPMLFVAAGVIWAVGLSNAYNFMDGIDGIAAVQAIVAGAGWVWLGWRNDDAVVAIAGAIAAGGSLGFLFYNWHPARIFMGDAGAAFLGFTFAVMTLVALARSWEHALAGALFVWPFLFDTAFTLARRLVRGENVLRAHRSHLYQRLVARGWSHRSVSALYGVLALAGVGVAVALL